MFAFPAMLVADVERNLKIEGEPPLSRTLSEDSGIDGFGTPSIRSPEKTLLNGASDSPVLRTGFQFVKKVSLEHTTEYAVAELCATFRSMPDTDPRKTRLMRRVAQSNANITPGGKFQLHEVRSALGLPPPPQFVKSSSVVSLGSAHFEESGELTQISLESAQLHGKDDSLSTSGSLSTTSVQTGCGWVMCCLPSPFRTAKRVKRPRSEARVSQRPVVEKENIEPEFTVDALKRIPVGQSRTSIRIVEVGSLPRYPDDNTPPSTFHRQRIARRYAIRPCGPPPRSTSAFARSKSCTTLRKTL